MQHYIDHVILGVSDLDAGVRQFESLTGVVPVRGGEHPDLGTHNALAGLGERTYLEILAPRPDADVVDWLNFLGTHTQLAPVMWIVGSDDLRETASGLTQIGIEVGEFAPGLREADDGAILEWRLMHPKDSSLAACVFFIEWSKRSMHPSRTSPPGCTLVSLEIAHSEPEKFRAMTDALGLRVGVYRAESAMTELILDTPKGVVRLSSKA